MEMSGVQEIPAPQQQVWDALNDPGVLKACIPGCESVDKTSDTQFAMAMTAVVGPVKAKFSGKLVISEAHPPDSYVLSFEGTGGAAGFGKGDASVALAPVAAGTQVSYRASAQIGGKIAQVGSRLVDGIAKKMAEEFFSRLNARFSPPALAEIALGAACTDTLAAELAAAHRTPSKPRGLWLTVAVIAVLVGAYYFSKR